ncbi:MAG TPA: hypothetical protein PKL08_03195 [Thermoanaerobaculaceae bacterium]|nr:hypothetical protein [Thermoanaerobaculaceae bacterium]
MVVSAFVLAAAVLSSPQDVSATEVRAGTPIVAVTVVRHDVFDTDQPGTQAWPYRAANALHFLTREAFIRSQLLFKSGDLLDPTLLAESERILRDHGFLNPVTINARPAPNGCEVVVETHDQWTTEVSANYGRFGQRSHAGASMSEENLLGWGKRLLLNVESENERNTVTFRYSDPLFLGRRLRLELARSNATDGSLDQVAVESPFFALATPYAGAVQWMREEREQWLYSGGHKAVSGAVRQHSFELWGGMRLPSPNGITRRLRVGLFHRFVEFDGWRWQDGRPFEAPEDRAMAGVLVGVERQPSRWTVVRGFRGWQRQEDVSLGPRWVASVGASLPALGADRTRLLFGSEASMAWMSGSWYSWTSMTVSGRLEGSRWVNGMTHVEAGTARTGEQGWRARVAADLGYELDRDAQVTLGADTGLRGWEPDTFDGTSRVVSNLEWRRKLTGEVLHLGNLGVTCFADAGKTWGARIGEPAHRWHADVGAGLLVELTRASVVRIVRVEVALPDDGRGPVLLATGTSLF